MKSRFSSNAKPYVKFFVFYGLLNMAISIMWGAYNNYFPIILQSGNPAFADGASVVAGFGLSAFATSLIMSIDNFFATFFLPIFGAWGDRTTKRRELGVIMGFVCVAAFISLPLLVSLINPAHSGDTKSLIPLLVLTVAIVFVCMFSDAVGGQFRSGYQYNMVPKEHQNKMSSFSVLFGGIGFLVMTFAGSALYHINEGFPFYIGGAVMLLVIIGFALASPPETEKNRKIEEKRASGEQGKFNLFKVIAETYKLLPKAARMCILMVFLVKIFANFGIYGMQTFGSSYMYGANPGGVLEHPGVIKPEQADRLRESWQSQFGGANAHKVAVLEEGLKFHQMSIPPEQAQFLETRKFQINEIARIFRVPPHMVGDLEKSSFSNIEQQSLEFVKYTLDPWVVRWEQSLQQALILPSEKTTIFIKFNLDGLLRGDYQSRMEGYSTGIQNGFMSVNDVRGLEDMNLLTAEEGGDLHFVNGNMVKLADVGAAYAVNGNNTNETEDTG